MATDLKGLNNFRSKLQKFATINSNFTTEVADEIAKRGEQIAISEYAGVEGVSVHHETLGGGASRVVAEGEQIAYIEFGTGRVGEQSKYPTEKLPKEGVPITGQWEYYYPSQYKRTSKTTGDEGWYHKFEGDDKARFTKGQSAGMQMYRTSQRLKNEMADIVKNKIKGDGTNV